MAAPDTFADWLRTYRRERGMTQQELADAAGLGRTYIIALEKGRIRLPQRDNRAKLHKVFGTDDAELEDFGLLAIDEFGGEWAPEPEPPIDDGATATAIHIDGLSADHSEGVGLVGAALIYVFRGMTTRQRQDVLDILHKVDRDIADGGSVLNSLRLVAEGSPDYDDE